MKKTFLFTILTCIYLHSFSQREFGVCDSTLYTLNQDTTIVAGRTKVYVYTNNTVTLLHDFTTLDTNQYIRDFDIIKPDLWYTVVGKRTIGAPTQLYKSTDKGITWSIDTNHYQANNSQTLSPQFLKSINNIQHLNGDTLLMFMHYYESGILYSIDLGQTWTKWFDNLITHYQGMFSCENKYYLFGYQGDAFRSWMFGFDKALLFTSDSNGAWSMLSQNGYHPRCSLQNDTLNCIYASSYISRCATYNFFKSKVDSLCGPLSASQILQDEIKIYPNPCQNRINITIGENQKAIFNIYSPIGARLETYTINNQATTIIDLSRYNKGIYYYSLQTNNGIQKGKIRKD